MNNFPDNLHYKFLEKLIDAYGYKEAMNVLARASGYKQAPPTIQQFLSDADFGGDFVGPKLRSCWRDLLHKVFPNPHYSPYLECALSGSIGCGKTVAASLGFCYDLCRLLCLENVQDYFGLIPSTVVEFSLISVTKTAVRSIDYDQIMAWIESSPFFRTLIIKNKSRKVTDPLFPNKINITIASRAAQTAGRAIISAFYDEANESIIKDQASELYSSILRRMESRFIQKGGALPSHFWLVSSKKDESAWLSNHVEEMKNRQDFLLCEMPIWVAKRDEGIYSGVTFRVFIGDRTHDPFVVDSDQDLLGLDDALVLDVPVEYEGSFRLDPIKSLQDIAGVGTWSSQKFLPFGELIEECQIRENPVTRTEISLDLFDRGDTIIQYLEYEKIPFSQAPRFVHCDLGLIHDRTGICGVRLDGWTTTSRYDISKQSYITVKEPIYFVDWIICAKGRSGQQFPITKVRLFFEELKKRGYRIAFISSDGYQSAQLLQDLTVYSGFETELLSVDRTREPYDHLKNVITESRLNCVRHPILDEELRNLLDVGKKIDHDASHGKDVADALCGAVYLAYSHQEDYTGSQYAPGEYFQALEKLSEEEYTTETFVDRFWGKNSERDASHSFWK